MGRMQGDNGFILFAKDLRKKRRDVTSNWEEFINGVASDHWKRLTIGEREMWKEESKQSRREQRETGTRRVRARSRTDRAEDVGLDEFEIMEQMSRKRGKDIKELHNALDWEYGNPEDRPRHMEHKYCLLAVEHFCQKTERAADGGDYQPPYYYPAEVAIVEFSLAQGITQEFHRVFDFFPDEDGDVKLRMVQEELETRTRLVHGLPIRMGDRETHLRDLKELRRFLSKEHGRQMFCFAADFLPVLGCLEHVSRCTGRGAIFHDPVKSMKCVEDLVLTLLEWTRAKVHSDDFRDLKSAIIRSIPDYQHSLCGVHGMMEEKPPASRLICCQGLVRGTVAFIRKWLENGGLDKEMKNAMKPQAFLPKAKVSKPDIVKSLEWNVSTATRDEDESRDVVELEDSDEDDGNVSMRSSVAEDEHVKALIKESKEQPSSGWEELILKAEETRKKQEEEKQQRRLQRKLGKATQEQKLTENREQLAQRQENLEQLAQRQENREQLAQRQENRKQLAQRQENREQLAQRQENLEQLAQRQENREQLAQRQGFNENPFMQSGLGRTKKTKVAFERPVTPAPGDLASSAVATPPPVAVGTVAAQSLAEFQFCLPVGQRGIGRGLQLLDLRRIFQAYRGSSAN